MLIHGKRTYPVCGTTPTEIFDPFLQLVYAPKVSKMIQCLLVSGDFKDVGDNSCHEVAKKIRPAVRHQRERERDDLTRARLYEAVDHRPYLACL
mmetsp:Transcript_58116/g.115212  ORF Transcript_58116/g.115212 Transcript_58116/m.115212 type:complete len:94 (-) Transcript_58116:142-423(-)